MDPILIVAGESSGERYGAGLVREFRKLHPEARFFGIGGRRDVREGVEVLFPMEHLAVMGIFEVISHVPRIRRIFRRIVQEADRGGPPRPSSSIPLTSISGWRAKLKKAGIPVLYYISPTVWAWRRGRLKTVRKHVARMMLIFPFEEEIYKAEDIPAKYIGHPLLERVKADS